MLKHRAASLSFVGFLIVSTLGAAEIARAQQYRFSRESLQCLLDNKSMVAAIQDPVIFLDISSCPPVAGKSGKDVEQRAVNKLQTKDSNLNAIIIIGRDKIECYFNVIQTRLQETQGDVDVDFSGC